MCNDAEAAILGIYIKAEQIIDASIHLIESVESGDFFTIHVPLGTDGWPVDLKNDAFQFRQQINHLKWRQHAFELLREAGDACTHFGQSLLQFDDLLLPVLHKLTLDQEGRLCMNVLHHFRKVHDDLTGWLTDISNLCCDEFTFTLGTDENRQFFGLVRKPPVTISILQGLRESLKSELSATVGQARSDGFELPGKPE